MKILFFINAFPRGGKERRLTELMKAMYLLPDVHFELVVMSKEINYPEIFDLGMNIHYLIRKTKKDLSIFHKFYKICKKYHPDFVHCWDGMTAIYSIPACKLLNIKLINGMVVDTPVVQNITNTHWLRAQITFPFSTVIIGNSNAGLAAYKAPKKKSTCIYNGMDMTRFKNLKSPYLIQKEIFGFEDNNIFIAGMVAAFEERKDYQTLIKAAITLLEKYNNFRFVLIGDGNDLNEIKKTVPLPLTEKIIFLGKRRDVESIINLFDVGILLTNARVHGEGISNSIIEYMALGKPVIATRGGGTNEVVIDNQNGYLIDSHNESQLIKKIEFLFKNKCSIDGLGKKGIQMANEKFDIKVMASNYISVYQKLMIKKQNQ